jgi:hypothetical protein
MEATFENAVSVLKIQAETSENNAPIWRQEGNLAQAELGERTAKSCRAAIAQLSQGEGMGIEGDGLGFIRHTPAG